MHCFLRAFIVVHLRALLTRVNGRSQRYDREVERTHNHRLKRLYLLFSYLRVVGNISTTIAVSKLQQIPTNVFVRAAKATVVGESCARYIHIVATPLVIPKNTKEKLQDIKCNFFERCTLL